MKIVSIIGARPQFIKASAVSHILRADKCFQETTIYTGQHYDWDMADVFFQELGIPSPEHCLGIHGGGHGDMTGRMLAAIEPILIEELPDRVLVYGDTNSTLAGALTAAKLHIPVAHVEAGLRSFNTRMPEEINRVLTDHVSSYLFCPTKTAVENLACENITHGVYHVGDVMYDAALLAADAAEKHSTIIDDLGLTPDSYTVATVHRAENTDDPAALAQILDYLRERAKEDPVAFPVHPRTKLSAKRFGLNFDGLKTCSPIGYFDMVQLTRHARCVYTDSGGLQKEAYFYRVPCVTLRDETEWVETVEAGWNRLWRNSTYRPRNDISDYGDGNTASMIIDILTEQVAGASLAE